MTVPDERTETVARLTEIVRVEMSKGAYQMLPGELPYESAARRVAAAVVAALDDETEALTEARDDWAKVAGERADQRDTARAALDRARAVCAQIEAMPIPADPGMSQTAITGRIVATITRAVRAALDPEEPR